MRSIATRSRIGLLVAASVVALLSPVPAQAAKHTVGEDVAKVLARYGGSVAQYDDSSTTNCIGGSDPEPLVYRNDRIIMRTPKPASQVRSIVNAALGFIGSPGAVDTVEQIRLPEPKTARTTDELTPIVVVTMKSQGEGTIHIVDLARRLRTMPNPIPSSPDYFLSVTSGPTGMWPDGFPEGTDIVEPQRDLSLGHDVRIWVYDVGVPPASQGNIAPNLSKLSSADNEVLDAKKPFGVVDRYYGGHTLAIADVINTLAPGATVKAVRVTEQNGVATDSSAARRMAKTLIKANDHDAWPQLIVNAFGSEACDLNPGVPEVDMVPIGLEAVTEAVDVNKQALMVISAGNRGTSEEFYPAAFAAGEWGDAVLSVGALDATTDADTDAWTSPSRSAEPADFSNFGSWVKAWAPGVKLSTRHVVGLRFEKTSDDIEGQAFVSGTSFAGPDAAALIAEVIASQGVDPFTAWNLIATNGMPCVTVDGIAIALTSMADSATTPPPPGTPSEC